MDGWILTISITIIIITIIVIDSIIIHPIDPFSITDYPALMVVVGWSPYLRTKWGYTLAWLLLLLSLLLFILIIWIIQDLGMPFKTSSQCSVQLSLVFHWIIPYFSFPFLIKAFVLGVGGQMGEWVKVGFIQLLSVVVVVMLHCVYGECYMNKVWLVDWFDYTGSIKTWGIPPPWVKSFSEVGNNEDNTCKE